MGRSDTASSLDVSMRYQLWADIINVSDNNWSWIIDTKVNRRNIMFPISTIARLFNSENIAFIFIHSAYQGDIMVAQADTLEELKLSVPWLFL